MHIEEAQSLREEKTWLEETIPPQGFVFSMGMERRIQSNIVCM